MKREGTTWHPSILSTVLGPITLGPSSSHMAGPVRLGLLAREIFGTTPERVTIVLGEGGSFAATYQSHGTDCALVAGLLGWDTKNTRIPQVFDEVKHRGMDVKFSIESRGWEHPNMVLFRGEKQGKAREVLGISEGGGSVRILEIDGRQVDIQGQYPTLFLLLDDGDGVDDVLVRLQALGTAATLHHQGGKTVTLTMNRLLTEYEMAQVRQYPMVVSLQQVQPVFLVPKPEAGKTPYFTSGRELLNKAMEGNRGLSEMGLLYEMNRLGYTREEVYRHLYEMVQVMDQSLQRGLSEDLPLAGGIVTQGGKALMAAYKEGKTISSGTLPRASAYAMAVNEVSASMGLIVAAPTAGACGVLPGALFAAAEEMGLPSSEEILARALLTAGAIGAVFAQRATFLAEYCGCQVESGIAAGMAGAALVEMKGGTPEQAMDAASITLQNILGMECDPVAGFMEVPCINRNALGACNALLSGDIVLAGVQSVIPFDEVIDAVYETGRFRPLQCNGTGGLAITPSSQKILCDKKKGKG